MIDSGNLQAASLYLNNQLLSRGLLRDGQAIDFAMLGYGHGGGVDTSRRIISVINDLILRRDRDAEQRESLSTAMRDLRDENLKYAGDVDRLTEKAAEAQRRFDIATASETSMRTQLRSAESAMRGLKDELARTKTLVAQARAACATEIKRRDRQMDTLKKQVGEAGRTRGAKGNAAVMAITVTGETGGGGGDERSSNRSSRASAHDSSLRSEANTFLAGVAQGLSEENESLLQTMRETMEQLREMSGWDEAEEEADALVARQPSWEELSVELDAVMEHMRSILTNPSFVPIEEVLVREEEIERLKAGWIKMESRWEDAVHLMDAWRKRMAVTGEPINEEDLRIGLSLSPVRVNSVEETRDARRPGLSEGHDGELRRDLRRVSNLSRPRHSSPPPETYAIEDESDDSGSEFNGFDDEILLDEHGVQIIDDAPRGEATTTLHRRPPSPDSPPLPEPPQLSPLKSVSSSAVNRRPRTVTVPLTKPKPPSTTEEEDRHEPENPEPPRPPQRCVKIPLRGVSHIRTKSSSSSSSKAPIFPSDNELSSRSSATTTTATTTRRREEPNPPDHGKDPCSSQAQQPPRRATRARAARTRHDGEAPSGAEAPSMTTIAAKLAASEKEADAARVRAKLRSAARAAGTTTTTTITTRSDTPTGSAAADPAGIRAPREPGRVRRRDDMDPVKRDPARAEEQKGERRRTERRASKTLSRRRSTLNRLELETLIVNAK